MELTFLKHLFKSCWGIHFILGIKYLDYKYQSVYNFEISSLQMSSVLDYFHFMPFQQRPESKINK